MIWRVPPGWSGNQTGGPEECTKRAKRKRRGLTGIITNQCRKFPGQKKPQNEKHEKGLTRIGAKEREFGTCKGRPGFFTADTAEWIQRQRK